VTRWLLYIPRFKGAADVPEKEMIAYSYFLFAFGVFVLIVGYLLAGVMKPPGSGLEIKSKMRDKDIMKVLKKQQGIFFPDLIVLLGYLCLFVSVGLAARVDICFLDALDVKVDRVGDSAVIAEK
jgi:hypothetical protein